MSTVKGFNTTLGVLKYDAESLDNYNTPLFDSTSTYEVGDYVIEDGKLYRCITDVLTAGSWSSVSSNFVIAILTDDIKGIKEDVGDLSTNFSTLEGNVETLEDNVGTLSSNVEILSTDVDSLTTDVDSLTTSVGKINNSIALTFDTSTSYAIGDYVLYGGSLYRFTATHAAGAWNSADAVQVQLAEDVADLKSATSELEENQYKAYAVRTVSGSIASFPDGVAMPVRDLSVDIEPVQDLHGFDRPWPAGGGKNLFNYTRCTGKNGLTVTVNADGSVTVSGVPTANYLQLSETPLQDITDILEDGASYTMSAADGYSGMANKLYLQIVGTKTDSTKSYITANGSDKTFTVDKSTYLNYVIYLTTGTVATWGDESLTFTKKWQLEKGVSKTSFAPYSNICPISGWTEANIYDDPKYAGLIEWNQMAQNGDMATTTFRTKWHLSVSVADNVASLATQSVGTTTQYDQQLAWYASTAPVNNHVYFATLDYKPKYSHDIRFPCFGHDGSSGSDFSPSFNFSVIADKWSTCATIVKPYRANTVFKDCVFLWCGMNSNVGYAINDVDQVRRMMFIDLTQLFGETVADYVYGLEQATAGDGVAWFRNLFPKDYYAYNAGTETLVSAVNGDPYWEYTIDLNGTRYGGQLDVTTGKLTVDRAYIDMGTMSWGKLTESHGVNFFSNTIQNDIKESTSAVIPQNIICSNYRTVSWRDITQSADVCIAQVVKQIRVRDSSLSSGDAAAFKTAMSGVQLVYELASPIVYNLTPVQVKTLLGINNIWADTGAVSVSYRADLSILLEELNIGKSLYFAEDGSDENPGTPASPKKDFSTFLNTGYSLYLKSGNTFYLPDSVLSSNEQKVYRLTNSTKISSYGGVEKPKVSGLIKTSSSFSLVSGNIYSASVSGRVGIIVIDGKRMWARVFSESLSADGEWYYDYDNSRVLVYSSTSLVGKTLTYTYGGTAFSIPGGSGSTIDGLEIEDWGVHGIQVSAGATNVVLSNNRVHDIGGGTLSIDGSPPSSDPVRRLGNGIEIWCDNLLDIIVKNNEVYNCYDAGITPQISTGSSSSGPSNGIVFKQNYVHDCNYLFEWFCGQHEVHAVIKNNLFLNARDITNGYRDNQYFMKSILRVGNSTSPDSELIFDGNTGITAGDAYIIWNANSSSLYGATITFNDIYASDSETKISYENVFPYTVNTILTVPATPVADKDFAVLGYYLALAKIKLVD